MKKPIQLRILFILNLLLVAICFVFYAIAKSKGNIGGLAPNTVLYTAISYTVLFVALVTAIKRLSLTGLRIVITLVFLVSIPASAFIGMFIAILSMVLSFHKKIKQYFNQ